MKTGNSSRDGRGWRSLAALAAVFFLPVIIAFWLYYGAPGWRPAGAANRGNLIDPAVPLPELTFAGTDGQPIAGDLLRDRWTLLVISAASCDAACREALYLTRQTRLALGKDADRVRRVYLATGPCCPQTALAAEHPDLVVAIPTQAQLDVLMRLIPRLDTSPSAAQPLTYIVDPLGNLMMSYPADAPEKAMLDDLERLLRLSHIG